ncbi:hypothetical protein BGZ95_011252 [Linnemannia exigua]|uniref:Secreted protein n=1 Tax=Linnemannia exigua TaxID=604196 RepID=A0AAD4DC71_9FUNG|nr:hypothetical protein BGZ95_011252 [Linnemannia exigua]
MKISVPLIIAALVSSTQAMKLGYSASTKEKWSGPDFMALLYIDDKIVAGTAKEEGSSSDWKQWGIHKIQLRNARMNGFEFCIDVFNDVSCTKVSTPSTECSAGSNQISQCSTKWSNDNWGGA